MFSAKDSNVLNSLICGLAVAAFLPFHAMANEMVSIPAGKFLYGSEKKTVELKAFQIQKTEVSWEEYQKVVKDASFEKGLEKHPAAEISYFDAESYCKAIGGRLPTMEEWQKAARGTDGRMYPWGNEFRSGLANTSESGATGTIPVGSYQDGKSPYGLLDMAGNVWEWVDAWDSSKRYRYVMGGSYFENMTQNTTTSTLSSIPDDMHLYIGFRCVKDK